MKLVICVFLMLISAKECDKNKVQLANDTASETPTEMTERRLQDSTKLTYQAVTRGSFLQVWVQGDSISFTNDRDLKMVRSFQLPKEDKEALITLLSTVDEQTLPELEAPSKAHQYDGAQLAWLEISEGENSYKTSIFDHGNPPKSISALVEKLLSVKGNIEKKNKQ